MGISRQDISKAAKISENGVLTKALKNLVSCDFIRKYNGFGKRSDRPVDCKERQDHQPLRDEVC